MEAETNAKNILVKLYDRDAMFSILCMRLNDGNLYTHQDYYTENQKETKKYIENVLLDANWLRERGEFFGFGNMLEAKQGKKK